MSNKLCIIECVSAWCEGSCNDGNNCCRQANPQFCLVKANLQDPCINMENSVVICPEALPSCLCYNDAGMYAPESFGAMALSCSSIAGSQYPQLLQYITGENGTLALCTRYAGPRNGTATTTPTSVPSTAASPSPTPTTAAAQSTVSLYRFSLRFCMMNLMLTIYHRRPQNLWEQKSTR